MRQIVVLTPTGRLGRRGFLLGFAGLLVVTTALLWVAPGFTYVFGSWPLIYLWVCLCSRRLHDMGWSAWIQLAPILATIGLAIVSFGIGLITLTIVGVTDGLGAFAGGGIILLLAVGVWTAFPIWLAVAPTKVENNPFGGRTTTPDA
jgi:uncharacterized membrane protein YhaH (DUF805 family)